MAGAWGRSRGTRRRDLKGQTPFGWEGTERRDLIRLLIELDFELGSESNKRYTRVRSERQTGL